MICWGTLYQQCVFLKDKSAAAVRRAYRRFWLRPFGPPRRLITDRGREFIASEFVDRVESDD